MRSLRPWLTPLWPVGHLPLKGGDPIAEAPRFLQSAEIAVMKNVAAHLVVCRRALPISLLEGEMADRPEGGSHRPQPHLSGITHMPEPAR